MTTYVGLEMAVKGTEERKGRAPVKGLGQRLAARRRALGFTQAQFAERLGVAVETLSRMEGNKSSISLARLAQFCDLLSLPIDQLLLDVSENVTDEARSLIKSLEDLQPGDRNLVLDTARHMASLLRKGKRQH
ncbi:helix-turn-helix domain-containing protein [Burkholderia vietnamiensis]|uniref:helix-turn-helix domain-containing protein n=1 Tax=Burkholderia vietnamiensis TaxID=60552 RepID=UPI001FC8A177|nr:helix-turn-helix transcriptional regulator [Burkholderia vietnamiensis]